MTTPETASPYLENFTPGQCFRQPVVVQTAVATVNGLRAASLGQLDSRRQVLAFMGIMAWVEPFELHRLGLLANAWNARLTVVDVPGCGYGGARLTPSQRSALRRGEFAAVARQMVQTAQAHNSRLCRSPVTIVGYSLGASLAAAAAADPGLVRVNSMLLVEPVALRRRRVSTLLRAVRAENRAVDEYVHLNDGIDGEATPPQRRSEPMPPWSRLDLAHLGYGLSRGQLIRDLLKPSDPLLLAASRARHRQQDVATSRRSPHAQAMSAQRVGGTRRPVGWPTRAVAFAERGHQPHRARTRVAGLTWSHQIVVADLHEA